MIEQPTLGGLAGETRKKIFAHKGDIKSTIYVCECGRKYLRTVNQQERCILCSRDQV
jgi:hypothetical protein